MVRVSEIKKHENGRIHVLLDDGTEYMILKPAYRERPVNVGDSLDPAEFSEWVTSRQYPSALHKAVAMLAARACSRNEVERKLLHTGYSSGTVNKVIDRLEKDGYLNDEEFAKQWSGYRSEKKYGPHRIMLELKNKGISSEEAKKVVDSIPDEVQLDDAVSLARKYILHTSKESSPERLRRKTMDYILRRGYGFDTARQAVQLALSETEDDP